MYHHSSSLLVAADLFLTTAYKNEAKIPTWLMAALKTPNNPAVIDNVIITANFADLYGEDEEFCEAPSWNRADYNHILAKDSSAKAKVQKTITVTDQMLLSFVDVNRQFRADFTFHIVLYSINDDIKVIDILDLDILAVVLDSTTDDHLVNWFLQRRVEVDAYINRFKTISPTMSIVVDNSSNAG